MPFQDLHAAIQLTLPLEAVIPERNTLVFAHESFRVLTEMCAPNECCRAALLNTHDMHASDIRWASRWDTYLLMIDDQIHWFSIINSVMIVLFLTGMVAMIIVRTLHRDITKYNQLESGEDAQEETGWKLVCALDMCASVRALIKGKTTIAVPAFKGSLAEASKVPGSASSCPGSAIPADGERVPHAHEAPRCKLQQHTCNVRSDMTCVCIKKSRKTIRTG
eukprot:1156138-Pelagomonas_calceolata.AAC.15